MSIERDEIIAELRELFDGAWGLAGRQESVGAKHLTAGDWAAFRQSVNRAHDFLREVDGPKVKTDCICHGRTPGVSLSGRPCPVHKTKD